MQDAVSAADPQIVADTQALRDTFLRDLAENATALDPGDLATLRTAVHDYYNVAVAVSRRLIAGDTGEKIGAEIQAMQSQQTRTSELLVKAASFDRTELASAFAAAQREQDIATQIRVVISIACLLVVVALALWIGRGLLRSLAHLADGFSRFGRGDFSTPILVISRDEIAAVAALGQPTMADSLRQASAPSAIASAGRKNGKPPALAESCAALLPSPAARSPDRAVGFFVAGSRHRSARSTTPMTAASCASSAATLSLSTWRSQKSRPCRSRSARAWSDRPR